MDALVARADALEPLSKKRRSTGAAASAASSSRRLGSGTATPHAPHGAARRRTATAKSGTGGGKQKIHSTQKQRRRQGEGQHDQTLSSVAQRTRVPRSLRDDPAGKHPGADAVGDGDAATAGAAAAFKHIPDRKLRARLAGERTAAAARATQLADAEALLHAAPARAGTLQATAPLERTWRVAQAELAAADGVGRAAAAAGRRELVLDDDSGRGGGGGYRARWGRSGRHVALVGRRGHVASVDWAAGAVCAEIQLRETCRDVTYLHSHHHVAVAQARHAFIYDQDLVELHRLSALVEPAFLEFLPYHWLLVCAGLPGTLTYLDTSTGTIVAQHRPKLGPPTALAQNLHNAVIYWGAGNGTVSLWTPSSSTPHVRLLAHLGPVTALSIDPSTGGRYLATGGMDGRVKVWDSRNYGAPVREWTPRSGPASALEWSQRGVLAVASGGHINTYTSPTIRTVAALPPPLYLTHPLLSGAKPATSLRFQPFQDVLAVGHAKGISSILVPGAGEPNLDSAEADPFENKTRRAEREVRSLLDKIQPDMITLDPEFVGSLAPPSKLSYSDGAGDAGGARELGRVVRVRQEGDVPFRKMPRLERLRAQGRADESEVVPREEEEEEDGDGDGDGDETGEGPVAGAAAGGSEKKPRGVRNESGMKKKMRGKGRALKRYLKKKRKNVIEPSSIAIRAKLEKLRRVEREAAARRAAGGEPPAAGEQRSSALDRFRRSK